MGTRAQTQTTANSRNQPPSSRNRPPSYQATAGKDHPNMKAFITHGGLMGMQEGVSAGVPMLAIPMFGDQHINAKLIVQSGIGIKLDDDITLESFQHAVDEVLNNPKYFDKAREQSALFRDRPMSPMDTAIYWIEYVIRHKGAYHLRSAAMDLTWYQYLLLDVLVVSVSILVLVVVVIKKMYSHMNTRNRQKENKPVDYLKLSSKLQSVIRNS